MVDDAHKIQVPTSVDEIAQRWLDDVELECRNIGITSPPVQVGTDWWLQSRANGSLGLLAFAAVLQADTDASILDATGEPLDLLRRSYGLPEVQPSSATGRVVPTISGTRSLVDGEPLTGANGVRYKVNGTQVGLTDGDEVDVVAVDTGTETNADSGEVINFDNAPIGFAEATTVSNTVPLTGGLDEESDDRKRERILNRLQNTPAGGNPGHIREIGFNALANLENLYVYPALGGPASFKAVPTKAFDIDRNDFSRALDSSALSLVRQAIQAEIETGVEAVIQASADETVNIAITAELPDSILAGGDGTGWTDSAPWPQLEGGDTVVTVTAVDASDPTITFTLSATTSTEPVDGLTNISWWSSNEQKFHTRLVTSHSGATTAWVVTVDRPLVDNDGTAIAVGDYVSPAATNLEAYGDTWVGIVGTLGPGENTSDTNRTPRANRIPKDTTGPQSDLNAKLFRKMYETHEEIQDLDYSYRSLSTPTVPASVDVAPNVLVPQHFGIYQA